MENIEKNRKLMLELVKKLKTESVKKSASGISKSIKENETSIVPIPSKIKVKLNQAIDNIKQFDLTYKQKLQVVNQIIDGLGIDKREFLKITTKLKSNM